MFNAAMQPRNFAWAWLRLGVTGSAKADEVRRFVAITDRVGNDVVNVQLAALARQLAFRLAAPLAAKAVTKSNAIGNIFPAKAALVILGRSAFPSARRLPLGCADAGRDVAVMGTEAAVLALACGDCDAAMFAGKADRPNAVPSCGMVALHSAEHGGVSAVCVDGKFRAASFANLGDASNGLALKSRLARSIGGLWVRVCASTRTILLNGPSSEGNAAFLAGVVNCFHSMNIGGSAFRFKYFDICVKRITDAHKQADLFVSKPAYAAPVQEPLL